jgi:hypothetical protein
VREAKFFMPIEPAQSAQLLLRRAGHDATRCAFEIRREQTLVARGTLDVAHVTAPTHPSNGRSGPRRVARRAVAVAHAGFQGRPPSDGDSSPSSPRCTS